MNIIRKLFANKTRIVSIGLTVALALTGAGAYGAYYFDQKHRDANYLAFTAELEETNAQINKVDLVASQTSIENGLFADEVKALLKTIESYSKNGTAFSETQIETLQQAVTLLKQAPITFGFYEQSKIDEAKELLNEETTVEDLELELTFNPAAVETIEAPITVAQEAERLTQLNTAKHDLGRAEALLEKRADQNRDLQAAVRETQPLLLETITGIADQAETLIKKYDKSSSRRVEKINTLAKQEVPSTTEEALGLLNDYIDAVKALKDSHDRKVKEEADRKAAEKAAAEAVANGGGYVDNNGYYYDGGSTGGYYNGGGGTSNNSWNAPATPNNGSPTPTAPSTPNNNSPAPTVPPTPSTPPPQNIQWPNVPLGQECPVGYIKGSWGQVGNHPPIQYCVEFTGWH